MPGTVVFKFEDLDVRLCQLVLQTSYILQGSLQIFLSLRVSTSALGASPFRVIVLHVLPNVASPVIVRASIGMGFTILTAAALGFLGLGAPPPTPEWGRTIAESREFLPDAWWYAAAPGVAIFLTVMGFNLLGDGLRDVLDPRLRRARAAGSGASDG